jgi:hypothetical protein
MIIEFDKSFEKSLDKIKNKSLFPRIEKIILEFEKSKSLTIPLEVTAPARKQRRTEFTSSAKPMRSRGFKAEQTISIQDY